MSKASHWFLIWGTLLVLLAALVYRWYTYRHSLAGLYVSSNVEAEIWLNNRLVGQVPFLDEKLKTGSNLLKIVPENGFYPPFETVLNLESGYLTVIDWHWQLETGKSFGLIYEISDASASSVVINSSPDRALVYWHGDSQPLFAPTTIDGLDPGIYQFTLNLPGFESLNGVLEIGEKQQITVTATLNSKTGTSNSEISSENESENESEDENNEENVENSTNDTATAQLIKILPTNYFESEVEVLRVRSEPNSNGEQLGVVNVGETLPYLSKSQNGWHKVLFQGKSGWISSDFSEISAN